ncbi:MAG TPA: glycosyltransferase family 2 protein [Nitrososphaerales archaeon]|nr:glycosyltransferase family 2 protein [Nitrososphaerales archaeon]
MQVEILEAALLLLYALFVLLLSLAALTGYRMFKPLARLSGGSGHKVSIIVAARNEADTLRESLASLSKLDYPDKEVIVVCGPSNDGTEELAREFEGRMTVLSEPERPPDWLGKSWACHHGYLRSTGDVLLFADGDVVHSRESLGVALANLDSKKADLLSVWPKIVTRTRSERLIFPTSVFFLCVGVAASARRTPEGRRVNGANGQYIMIRRDAYTAIGGHAAIKTDIMEDSAIGRGALGRGLEVLNADGDGFVDVLPYSRFGEAWEAHERFGAGLLPSWGALAGTVVVTLAYFVGPFALLGLAIATMNSAYAIVAACTCGLVLATQAFFSLKVSRARYLLLAPLSGLLVTAASATGFFRFRRGGITWKGTRYGIDRFKPL